MVPKLQGYGSFDAFSNFQKKSSQVTKLQKLRRLHRASAEDFPQLSLSCKVTEVSMLFSNFQKKTSLVTKLQRLRPELWSNPSIYLATTALYRRPKVHRSN